MGRLLQVLIVALLTAGCDSLVGPADTRCSAYGPTAEFAVVLDSLPGTYVLYVKGKTCLVKQPDETAGLLLLKLPAGVNTVGFTVDLNVEEMRRLR